MAIKRNELSFGEQFQLSLLSETDQNDVLNCNTLKEASLLLEERKDNIKLRPQSYKPKIQVSGSSVKYKTKNLFTETFDEQDVKDFISLVEMSINTEDEIIEGELKRKIQNMIKNGKEPLQCMVYATKNDEKLFQNNEKKMLTWAKVIANTVNSNIHYSSSINHMLVNWSLWKCQISLLINACGFIKQNENLDMVIRDLYTNYDDDKIKYIVIKRMFQSHNKDNYASAFEILKNSDFTRSDRKYFNVLKRKVENSTAQEIEKLYASFKKTQGFNIPKRKKIERLFFENNKENEIIQKINESKIQEKNAILKEIKEKIYSSKNGYKEITTQAKSIRQFKEEIQEIFMNRIKNNNIVLEEIKSYGLAIGDLDTNSKAIPFFQEQMSICTDSSKKLIFSYILASISDNHMDMFVDCILSYDGNNISPNLNSVRNMRQGKNVILRQYLYSNCLKIKDEYGLNSINFKRALRNMGIFLQSGHIESVYDVKFDQLIFDFIGYNKIERTLEQDKCSDENAHLILGILTNVMNKNNYQGRYMKFIWDLFNFFKNSNTEITNKIDLKVKGLTGQGIPTM